MSKKSELMFNKEITASELNEAHDRIVAGACDSLNLSIIKKRIVVKKNRLAWFSDRTRLLERMEFKLIKHIESISKIIEEYRSLKF